MSNIIQTLQDKKLISPPNWLANNLCYLIYTGSVAYGISSDTSDIDVYGYCIPKKEIIFPHLAGIVPHFGYQGVKFEQYIQHHVIDKDAQGGKGREYDFTIYNIVKYFDLLLDNNPSVLDSLYVPQNCVLLSTKVGNMVRDSRKMFLHKGLWHRFRGYSFSQKNKMFSKNPIGKRKEEKEKFIYDCKFATHTVRLLLEAEMLLAEGDMEIQRHKEMLKSIRRGEWSEQQINDWFNAKEKDLEKLYAESKLPYTSNEQEVKMLLVSCLEEHYGSLDKAIVIEGKEIEALKNIRKILDDLKI